MSKKKPITCSSDSLHLDKENLVSGAQIYKYVKLGKIQLEEILQNELSADYFNGSWVSSHEIAYYDQEYNLCLYNITSKVVKHLIRFPLVVSNYSFRRLNSTLYLITLRQLSRELKGLQLSSDLKYLLWASESIELFRYSKLEKLKIYNIANK